MGPPAAAVLSSLFIDFVRIPPGLPEGQIVEPHQPGFVVSVEQAVGPSFKPEVPCIIQRSVGVGFAPFHMEFPHPHSSGLRLVEVTLTDLTQ